MDEYLSERQQVEQVKAWVKENAAWAIGGLVIGFALLFGMKQWNLYTARQAQGAAEQYQSVLQALSSGDTAGADKMVKTLRDDYSRTPYPDLANLAYVRFDVEGGMTMHRKRSATRGQPFSMMSVVTSCSRRVTRRLRWTLGTRRSARASRAVWTGRLSN